MPAKDHYHDVVVRTLVKDGWTILREQYKVALENRRLWIDTHAAKSEQNLAILVEVKGFESSSSSVEALADAVGQYITYSVAILANKLDLSLYLAVPEAAFQGIFSEQLGKQIARYVNLKLVIFDPEQEIITRWLP